MMAVMVKSCLIKLLGVEGQPQTTSRGHALRRPAAGESVG